MGLKALALGGAQAVLGAVGLGITSLAGLAALLIMLGWV